MTLSTGKILVLEWILIRYFSYFCKIVYPKLLTYHMAKISTIGILTSGGDAPGMNAAIRAVTRAMESQRNIQRI